GRNQAERGERVRILLALADVDGQRRVGGEERGQAVEDAADVGELPYPSAVAIGAPLRKALRLVAHHLEQKLAVLVGVVVGRDDPPLGPLAVLREAEPLREVDVAAADPADRAKPRLLSSVPPGARMSVAV